MFIINRSYELRMFYDGKYYVLNFNAKNEKNAIEILESKINTAKEYEIISVKKQTLQALKGV